jgi:hypothetical protein
LPSLQDNIQSTPIARSNPKQIHPSYWVRLRKQN